MYEFNNRSLGNEELYFWLCQMARQIDSAIVVINPQKGYTIDYVNHVFTHMTEYNDEDMTGSTLSTLHGPLTDMLNEEAIQESIENGLTFKTASLHYRKDGSTFWNEVSNIPIRDQNGVLQYCVLIMKDVTDLMNVETLIDLERDVYFSLENGDMLEIVLGNVCKNVEMTFGKKCHCAIVIVDGNNHLVNIYGEWAHELKQINGEALFIGTQGEKESMLKKPTIIKNIQLSDYSEPYKQLMERYQLISLWSQPILNTEGKVIGIFTMYFEQESEPQATDFKFLNRLAPIVTLALKYYDQKNAIRQLAYFDVATGLSNFEQFKNTMLPLIDTGCEGYLYIIEPGEYQKIVELYGRQGGDETLYQLAKRIQNSPQFGDSVIARYTNSALIIATRLNFSDMKIPLQEVDGILFEPYYIDDKEVFVTLKIGTSNFSQQTPFKQAIRQADTALSTALKTTGTVIKQFEASQIEQVEQEMKVLAHISKGFKNNEFFPMLQPKVNIETQEIVGFEALARWNSADIGFVSPAEFIPVAESTGNIAKIDSEIFKKVLQWQKQRLDAGLRIYQVSVNISPSHFYNPTFIESSMQLVADYGIATHFIKFEITESVELENVVRAKKIINDLRKHGIATSIDDFGVGYSSLSYLQELPFEEIKIDKSFVDNLAEPRMNAVIKTIIQLSNSLTMVSVAEGIETKEQHLELKRLGCNCGQGYYYYRPMPLNDVDDLLAQVSSN